MRSRSALFAVVAACGGGGGTVIPSDSQGDAPPIDVAIDAPADAPPVDAPDESTRVEVVAHTRHGKGGVDPTAVAIFRDPSGNVIKHGVVDANGRGFAYMPLGGDVLVLYTRDSATTLKERFVDITVFRGVKAGDRLSAGSPQWTPNREGVPLTVMQAGFTSIGPSGPGLLAACPTDGGIGNPRNMTFYPSCVPATFDVLAIQDEAVTTTRKYVWMEDVPYVSGGLFTVPNTWQALPTNTTTFLNVPTNLARVGAELYAVVDGLPFRLDFEGSELPPPTTSVSLFYAPPSMSLVVAQTVQGIKTFERYAVVTPTPAAVTIDWASLSLPVVTGAQQTNTAVTWNETFAGMPDGRHVLWASQWQDGNLITRYASYSIIEAGTPATSSTLPTLPTAYAEDDPSIHPGTLRAVLVSYFDYDIFPGYDAARQHGPAITNVEGALLTTPHHAKVSFNR